MAGLEDRPTVNQSSVQEASGSPSATDQLINKLDNVHIAKVSTTSQGSATTNAMEPRIGKADGAPPKRYVGQSQSEGEDTPDSQPAQEERPSNTTERENIGQNVSLSALCDDYNFVIELAKLLDPSSPNGNWESLAYRFGMSRPELNKIKYGGTAHSNFFVKLAMEKPNVTINDVRKCLESGIPGMCNNKIFSDIDQLPQEEKPKFDERLGSLVDNTESFMFVETYIADKLRHTDISRTLSWKNVAGYYGYSYEEIKSIADGGKPQREGPTLLLIASLVGRQENFMVSTFIEHLKNMKRNDVAGKVRKWVKEQKSESRDTI